MKRPTPGIWGLLVLSVIALGLLAGGCSSEPPPPPCQPVSDDAVDSTRTEGERSLYFPAASLVEINRQREQAEEIARRPKPHGASRRTRRSGAG